MDFEAYKKAHPGAKFSDYYVYKLAALIEEGTPHGALGKTLSAQGAEVDFEDAGRDEFEKYRTWFDLTPKTRVIDYGCGSFRVGLHFIRWSEPGHYFGLDLTDDFMAPGRERLTERLGPNWQAAFGTIDDRYDDAVAHAADFVFSSNVAYHVHPDECAEYYERLAGLAHKPGCLLCFDSRIARKEVRFGDRNWAYPLDFHLNALPDFDLVRTVPARDTLAALMDARDVVRVIFQLKRR